MILLTTLRGDRFGLNPDLVEEIRANGSNCVVTLITGRSYTAQEDVETVQEILHRDRVELLREAAGPASGPAVDVDLDVDAEGDSAEPRTGHHAVHPDYLTPVPTEPTTPHRKEH